MEVHGYTEFGRIEATIDGSLRSIPDDPGNNERRLITEWEAEGNIIPPYVPAPAPMPPLSPRQIRLALLSAGITEGMVDAALADNAAGLIEWKYATAYERNHPLIGALAGSFSLTTEQVDSLWGEAVQL